MLILLSPAKTLDFESTKRVSEASVPDFASQASELISRLKTYAIAELMDLMSISDKLALLNHQRFQQWSPVITSDSRAAICAFKGEVYSGLNVEDWSTRDFNFAQQHIRILSGLYGVLRPLDAINPFRLEMGTRLQNKNGNTLYEFWGDILTKAIVDQLSVLSNKVLINLASNEYYKAINPNQIGVRIITPVFKDAKNGQYKIVSIFAKKARGTMARYIVKNQISDVERLKLFAEDGYFYNDRLSRTDEWVFTRD